MKKAVNKSKGRTYKIIKNFQGGMNIYYARVGVGKRVMKGAWDYQLEEWGKGTIGGHGYGYGYGYSIEAKPVKSVPKGWRRDKVLKFNKWNLENLEKVK